MDFALQWDIMMARYLSWSCSGIECIGWIFFTSWSLPMRFVFFDLGRRVHIFVNLIENVVA